MRYAVAVAEHGHFGRAAAALGMAQPPLSRQIAALEREVETLLFERTPRGAVPTAAGSVFVGHARRILGDVSSGAADARRAARGETGTLRLGFISSALVALLPSLLARFRALHPAVALELSESSSRHSTEALLAGDVDIAVTRGSPRGAGAERLVALPVGHDSLVVVGPRGHPFAGQAGLTLEQLRGEPLVAAPDDEEPATTGALADLLHERDPATVTRARDVHTIVGLAACGVGLGLLPACARGAARPDTWIAEVTPAVRLPDLVLTFRADDASPTLAAFLATVAEHCPGTGERLSHLGLTLAS